MTAKNVMTRDALMHKLITDACNEDWGAVYEPFLAIKRSEWSNLEMAHSSNLWISAGHIAGKYNVEADQASRQIQTATEWMHALEKLQFTLEIYLSASRVNG